MWEHVLGAWCAGASSPHKAGVMEVFYTRVCARGAHVPIVWDRALCVRWQPALVAGART